VVLLPKARRSDKFGNSIVGVGTYFISITYDLKLLAAFLLGIPSG
jgi:hypothetical protein